MDYTVHYSPSLGGIVLDGNGKALLGLWFDDQEYSTSSLAKQYKIKELPVFEETERWLDIYFSGGIPDFTPPLSVKYSDFRKSVQKIILGVPYGHTVAYGGIADKVAKERELESISAQTVGGAVEHNSISLIIPYHRVVGSSGSLTGYVGGINREVQLLILEKANAEYFFVPKKGTAL